MSRTKIKVLLVFFALFTLTSFIFLTYTTQLPTGETQTTTLCTYTQDGTYDYIAKLEQPNLIYENKSTLKPGEGIIYWQITEHINITFNYIFESSLNANTTIKYTVNEYVKTPRWTRQTLTIPQEIIVDSSHSTSCSVDIPKIDIDSIAALVSSINSEIGVSTSNYNVTITTTIILNAETAEGTINEPFTETLTLAFLRGTPQGHIISIENLKTTKTGKITETQTIHYDWVKNQQYASYATSAVAIIGLALFIMLFFKTRPPQAQIPPEKLIQDLTEPYEDILVEATEEPTTRGQTTVTMKSLGDLVKIADTLSKPIIHIQELLSKENEEPLHIFYILDGTTQYEYRITASEIKAAEELLPEENEED